MSKAKRPNGSRFRDALVIVNPCAGNPSGIALSIADACREMREHENPGTTEICGDPAIRLMIYQLASICDVAEYALERYIADETACKERLAEVGLKPRSGRLSYSTPADRSRRGSGRRNIQQENIRCPNSSSRSTTDRGGYTESRER
jgi:hypothetical protein